MVKRSAASIARRDARRIRELAKWVDLLVESDDFGKVHWSRDLAGLLEVAPRGVLKYAREDYEPELSPGNARRLRWDLPTVVEHGLMAWASLHDDFSDGLPGEVFDDLVSVRPLLNERLQSEIDELLQYGRESQP